MEIYDVWLKVIGQYRNEKQSLGESHLVSQSHGTITGAMWLLLFCFVPSITPTSMQFSNSCPTPNLEGHLGRVLGR